MRRAARVSQATGLRGDAAWPLAVAPLALLYLAFLASWGWRSLGWPLALYLPPTYWAAILALLVGASLGLRRGLPRWGYAWAAISLYGLGTAGEVAVFAAYSAGGVLDLNVESAFSWTTRGVNLLWVMLALVAVAYLSRRHSRDAMFFFALFLGGRAVGFPILTGDAAAPALTGALATVAALQVVAAAWLLRRFLADRPPLWLPFWGMVGLAAVNVPLKLWPVLLRSGPLAERLQRLGTGIGGEWLQLAFLVAAALVSSWVYLALRERSQ